MLRLYIRYISQLIRSRINRRADRILPVRARYVIPYRLDLARSPLAIRDTGKMRIRHTEYTRERNVG